MHHLPNIINQLSSKDLFEAFKLQLTKDFEQSNFPAAFVNNLQPNYNQILEEISAELYKNEKKSDFNLMQLLYRIDISENQLKKYLQEFKNEKYHSVIAELIIKRILQKVVLKQHYKNNENS